MREDDRNGFRRIRRREGRGGRRCHDCVDFEIDQLLCKSWEPFKLSLSPPEFKDKVLADNPAQLLKRPPKRVRVTRSVCQQPDASDLSRLLRLGDDRRGEEGDGEDDRERGRLSHYVTSTT